MIVSRAAWDDAKGVDGGGESGGVGARGLSPVSPVGQLVQYSAAEVVGTHAKCGVGVHVGWVWLLVCSSFLVRSVRFSRSSSRES